MVGVTYDLYVENELHNGWTPGGLGVYSESVLFQMALQAIS